MASARRASKQINDDRTDFKQWISCIGFVVEVKEGGENHPVNNFITFTLHHTLLQ
jgi:hypothetical protein